VEELLAERGLDVSYETVRRWVLKFGPLIAQAATGPPAPERAMAPRQDDRPDRREADVPVARRRPRGRGLDMLVQRRRDTQAALRLMRKLLKKQGFAPKLLVTAKLGS
jgi:putative transposase